MHLTVDTFKFQRITNVNQRFCKSTPLSTANVNDAINAIFTCLMTSLKQEVYHYKWNVLNTKRNYFYKTMIAPKV